MRSLWIVLSLFVGVLACTDRSQSPTTPAAMTIGTNRTVFAATSRQPTKEGMYGSDRSQELDLLELTVSIPPSHTPGALEFGYANPNPEKQFVMAGRHKFSSVDAFQSKIRHSLSRLPPAQQEVTVFVHGYNATQAETAFRAAQISNDIETPGAMVIYSWPSRAKALGYVYDNDSMLFARDGLEQLLYGIKATGARRVVLVAHSLGSALVMETLRQIELQKPGWAAKSLGGVILISPDLDVEVFRGQLDHLAKVPQPFVVFVSKKDTALNISSRLRGRGRVRLGNISSVAEVADLPIEIVDTTAFSDTAGSSHFVPATSPALISLLTQARTLHDTFDSEHRSIDNLLTGNTINSGSAITLVVLR